MAAARDHRQQGDDQHRLETTLPAGLIFERRLFNGLCSTEDRAKA